MKCGAHFPIRLAGERGPGCALHMPSRRMRFVPGDRRTLARLRAPPAWKGRSLPSCWNGSAARYTMKRGVFLKRRRILAVKHGWSVFSCAIRWRECLEWRAGFCSSATAPGAVRGNWRTYSMPANRGFQGWNARRAAILFRHGYTDERRFTNQYPLAPSAFCAMLQQSHAQRFKSTCASSRKGTPSPASSSACSGQPGASRPVQFTTRWHG